MKCTSSKIKRQRSVHGAVSGDRQTDPSPFFLAADPHLENQADSIAAKVVAGRENSFFSPGSQANLTGAPIQRKENSSSASVDGSTVSSAINSPGKPLDGKTKQFMESRFGQNFDSVKIHNDGMAHHSADAINARAYTHQNHIVFGSTEYNPSTFSGKQLLAHELAHVVQQRNGTTGSKIVQRSVIPTEMPCTPTPLSRQNFITQTGITDFGLTKIVVSQANLLSSPYVQFANVGSKVKMLPLTLNMPVIQSVFTQDGMFMEGKTGNQISSRTCPADHYPIRWNVTPTGADSLKEAEQEHCNDYNFAYKNSVYPFLIAVNKTAKAGKQFGSMAKADAHLKKILKFDPHDWFSRFTCMISNSTSRDHAQGNIKTGITPAWHEPKPILQALPHINSGCNFVTFAIIPSSFSGLGNAHKTDDIIPKGCT